MRWTESTYLDMKRKESRRQQKAAAVARTRSPFHSRGSTMPGR